MTIGLRGRRCSTGGSLPSLTSAASWGASASLPGRPAGAEAAAGWVAAAAGALAAGAAAGLVGSAAAAGFVAAAPSAAGLAAAGGAAAGGSLAGTAVGSIAGGRPQASRAVPAAADRASKPRRLIERERRANIVAPPGFLRGLVYTAVRRSRRRGSGHRGVLAARPPTSARRRS